MPKRFLTQIPSDAEERNSIGGSCFLPQGHDMPRCSLCHAPMILFFQFDLLAEFELPFEVGSHLSVFMCPEHNEIPSFDRFEKLPPNYWAATEGHWQAFLTRPSTEASARSPQFLQPARLVAKDTPENGKGFLAVGGQPSWLQEPERFTCCCGAEMAFVCQLSDGYHFPKVPEAPPQPDSPSSKDYVLFLGNEVYVFACTEQCHQNAVWITVQN